MSLSVDVYTTDDNGEMVLHDPKDYSETLAGFESYRTEVYGSELAMRLRFKVLPTLASTDIYAKGQEVNKLKTEAEIMMREASAFAEYVKEDADGIKQRADNIRKACIRARKMQGNVVIW